MSLIERYRTFYAHEKDCNDKMLTMLESVPEAGRGDDRFQRAVNIAGHLAACRENWRTCMDEGRQDWVPWFETQCDLATLRPRFAALEAKWTDYLARLDETTLAQSFAFADNGETFRIPTEVQVAQLVGHAFYHRGQVALLVDQLGGETVDTDYVDWVWSQQP